MTQIPIRSCYFCSPEKWRQVGPAVGSYVCQKCRKTTTEVLRRRKETGK